MRLATIISALVLTVGILSACGPEIGWQKKDFNEDVLAVDSANCEWDLTHKELSDGTYETVEIDDETLERKIRECLESKGYTWGPVED